MRADWVGGIEIRASMTYIPVKLYSVAKPECGPVVHLWDAKSLSRVRTQRIAEVTGKPVSSDAVLRVCETERGSVVLPLKIYESIDLDTPHIFKVDSFVPVSKIDPAFFEKNFYVQATKDNIDPYLVFREALEKTGKAAIGTIGWKKRLYFAAVQAQGKLLVLHRMYYAHEIVETKPLEPPKRKANPKSLQFAIAIIEKHTKRWNPNRYKNEHLRSLTNYVEEQIEAGEILEQKSKLPKKKITDISEILQEAEERRLKKKHR